MKLNLKEEGQNRTLNNLKVHLCCALMFFLFHLNESRIPTNILTYLQNEFKKGDHERNKMIIFGYKVKIQRSVFQKETILSVKPNFTFFLNLTHLEQVYQMTLKPDIMRKSKKNALIAIPGWSQFPSKKGPSFIFNPKQCITGFDF